MFFKRFRISFSISYQLAKVYFQMLYGVWRISRLELPIVSIFGAHRFKMDNPYAIQAQKLAHMISQAGISVVTGGGAGIMEAANLGAFTDKKGKGNSIGIGVKELGEGRNPYVSEYFELDYFFARKWLLTRFSVAFVIFPGGFGTLDELADVLVLIKTNKVPRVPIILIGKEFWQPFVNWLVNELRKHDVLEKEALELFEVTDDIHRAFSLICVTCKIDV